jgi:opacity protein-like surface antigen
MSSFSARHRHVGMSAAAFVAGLALTLLAQPAAAQQSGGITPFSAIYFSTGTMLMDVTKLNPHFERTDIANPANRPGFFTLSNDGYSIGGGAYGAVLDRLLVGGEWHMADIGEESSPSGKTNALTTNYFMGTVGYAAWTSWRINVAPYLGLGLGSAALTLKDRNGGSTVSSTQDPTFDEIVEKPGSKSVIDGKYVMVQPGIRVDFLLLPQTTSRMGIVVGVHLSSAISPNRTTWTYQGRQVFGGPDMGPSGGLLRVVAGFGGFRLGR